MKTNKGTIRLNLHADKAPVTVASFVNLAQRGYYDGLSFHRVINDFMVQGGCPQGTGTGGPGYQFEDECTPDLKHDKPGILSMANRGPNTDGSQFFLTFLATPWLDGRHTVFGEVVDGMDVVKALEKSGSPDGSGRTSEKLVLESAAADGSAIGSSVDVSTAVSPSVIAGAGSTPD